MNDTGPWGSETPGTPPRRARRGVRVGLLLCVVAALAALVVALSHAFPEAIRSRDDWAWVGFRAGVVVLLAAGLLRGGRIRGAHLRHAAIWTVIVCVLVLGFAYRDEFGGVGEHLRLAFSGGDPVRTADHELVVPQDEEGAFLLIARVNGQRVRFLIDTGASDTVLSPDDARRIGVDVDHLRYAKAAETANGMGYGAPFSARSFEVGPIALRDFGMIVNQAPMSSSLLGVTFLNRLDSFQVKDHKLILRWREPPG